MALQEFIITDVRWGGSRTHGDPVNVITMSEPLLAEVIKGLLDTIRIL